MSSELLEKTDDSTLFSFDELDAIQATGSPWRSTPNDPATVPVPLQTIIMRIDGPYTQRDRKLWNFLLHAVFDELGTKPMHSVSVRDINAVFRDHGGEHDSAWIWESAKRLTRSVAEWECTFGDDRVLGVAAIFGATITRANRQSGMLHFFFPPNLIPILKNPLRFARIRMHFLLGLSGKYAVTLYEILEAYVNRHDKTCDVRIEELRRWLKVPDGTYKNWKDFKKWVLEPAIKQINDDPLASGFTVEYTPVRDGRFYDRLIFTLTKTPLRVQQETRLRSKKALADLIIIPPEFEDEARDVLREKRIDYGSILAEYRAWAGGKAPPKQGYGAAFVGFCKKKARS